MPRGVYERKPKSDKAEDTVADQTDQRTDTEQEADKQAELAREEIANQGELCAACWPDGWPGDGDAAECSHGTWTR